jgi:HAD superfamily hydrolase (TIGR01549 family)
VTVAAVTFDFWNTLVRPDVAGTLRRRNEGWCRVAAERRVPIDPEVIESLFAHVSERHHAGWLTNTPFTTEHALVEVFGLLGDLVNEDDRAAFRESWLDAGRRADARLVPGAAEVLAELDASGMRIGIICDVGLTPSVVLRELLERHAVLHHFDHWSFSDEVGVYKPHPAIFRHALDGLGVSDPSQAVHVGDLRRTDIVGARGVGMTAVRFRGVADDPAAQDATAEGHHVIDDLRQLLAIAGAPSVPARSRDGS